MDKYFALICKVKTKLDYLSKCMDPHYFSSDISLDGLTECRFHFRLAFNEEYFQEALEALEEAKDIMYDKGYRGNGQFTCQEHKLFGSTISREECLVHPHQPIGLISGNLNLEETIKARELTRHLKDINGKYFQQKGLVTISVEPLDPTGNTIKDPIILDPQDSPLPTNYSPNFPFRRK